MEGREWWCWAIVIIHGQGVVVGHVRSPCVCGFSCLQAVIIHWWQVVVVHGWGVVICGLGVVHTIHWCWVVVGVHLGVVCEWWGSSACSAHRSLWGADVHGQRLWVYVLHGWGQMFRAVGAWLSFVGTLVPWCVSCHVSYGHH